MAMQTRKADKLNYDVAPYLKKGELTALIANGKARVVRNKGNLSRLKAVKRMALKRA